MQPYILNMIEVLTFNIAQLCKNTIKRQWQFQKAGMLMFQKATFEEFLDFSLNSCLQDKILEKMHQPRSIGRYAPMFWGNALENKWYTLHIHPYYWHLIDKGIGRPAGGEGQKCTAIPWCLACPASMYILKVLRVYPSMHNCTYIPTVCQRETERKSWNISNVYQEGIVEPSTAVLGLPLVSRVS